MSSLSMKGEAPGPAGQYYALITRKSVSEVRNLVGVPTADVYRGNFEALVRVRGQAEWATLREHVRSDRTRTRVIARGRADFRHLGRGMFHPLALPKTLWPRLTSLGIPPKYFIVQIQNLPPNSTMADVKDLLALGNLKKYKSIFVPRLDLGAPSQDAFVGFKQAAQAQDAVIVLSNLNWKERVLTAS